MKSRIQFRIIDRRTKDILNRVKSLLGKSLNFYSEDDIKKINAVLEESLLYDYSPEMVKELASFVSEKCVDIPKLPRDRTQIQKKQMNCNHVAKRILELIPYRFFYIGGGMGETRTFYCDGNHEKVWEMANEYCISSLKGNVRSIICLTKNGEDTGALKNLEAMFSPIIEDQPVRSVRASDLLPEYEEYK